MKSTRIILLLLLFITPMAAYAADPLCSDGSAAPAGNICNCAQTFSIGGSNFTPGQGSSLGSNTYGGNGSAGSGMNFAGIGGALVSCANIGGAISNLATNLQSTGTFSFKDKSSTKTKGATNKVPTNDSSTSDNTGAISKDTAQATKREQCLNGAAYALAKTALQKVSDKTLNWVKTGFNGNPLYVRDTESFLTSIKNQELKTYLDTVKTDNPIFGNALNSIIKEQVTGWSDGLINKTMNTPEGRAYQDFQSDFTQGGWSAFLNPDNNPLGAYFNAADQLSGKINTAQQDTKDELQQGNGFLSMRKCVEYASPTAAGSSDTTCADNAEATAQAAHSDCVNATAGQAPQDQSANQQICDVALTTAEAQISSQCSSSTTPAAPAHKATCTRYEVVTPGSLIANQVAGVTNSTSQVLINADKINETLGTFFTQLLNRLFTDGLSGTGNGSSKGATSSGWTLGTNVVTGSNGQTLSSAAACQTPLGYDPSTGGFDQEFDISRPQQLRAVILTQKNFLTRMQDAKFVMDKFIPRLGALDYCIPGPNPTYNQGLNENAEAFISALQPLTQTNNNTATTVIQGILDPGHLLTGAGCALFPSSCDNTPHIVGYSTARVSLFDKVDGDQKQIADRVYQTGAIPDLINVFFSDVLKQIKGLLASIYSDDAIINNFAITSNDPAQQTFIKSQIKESIKETANLVGYSQGVAQYDDYYTTTIENTQDAITELISIDTEVEGIVATAKARYIADHNTAPAIPINTSCIDNAYQLGTIPAGVEHSEDITAGLDGFQLQSAASKTYFYSHL